MGLFDIFKSNNNINKMETIKDNSNLTYTSDKYVEENTTNYLASYNAVFRVTDVFTITGRGTVVTGIVEKGSFTINDSVNVNGISTTILGIEAFRNIKDTAVEGDNVGILLKDVDRKSVCRGNIIVK